VANAVFPKYKENLLQGTANYDLDQSGSAGVFVALVDAGVAAYNSAHQFYSDISAGVIATSSELSSKTYTNGTFDAADTTFTSATGAQSEALVIFRKVAATASTSWPLVAWIDTSVTNLPVTPNGGDIIVQWDAAGIFSL
jgi:hypothetical protein